MEKNDSLIGHICNLTGLSNRSLARLIEVDNSLLSKTNAGSRNIPAAALPQIARLHSLLQNAPPAQPLTLPAEPFAELREEAMLLRGTAHQLQKKLTAMQAIYTQAMALLHLVQSLAQATPDMPEKKQRWLDGHTYQANKKMQHNNPVKQKKLAIEIATLQYKAGLYDAAEENGAGMEK